MYVVKPDGRRFLINVPLTLDNMQKMVNGDNIDYFPLRNDESIVAFGGDYGMYQELDNRLAFSILNSFGLQSESMCYGNVVFHLERDGKSFPLTKKHVQMIERHFQLPPTIDLSRQEGAIENFKSIIQSYTYVRRYLRVASEDGGEMRVLKEDSYGEKLGKPCDYFKNGIRIEKLNEDLYEFFVDTVDDGRHVFSVCARVNSTGALVELGSVNTFALGTRIFDEQAYLDEFYEELVATQNDRRLIWDSCKSHSPKT